MLDNPLIYTDPSGHYVLEVLAVGAVLLGGSAIGVGVPAIIEQAQNWLTGESDKPSVVAPAGLEVAKVNAGIFLGFVGGEALGGVISGALPLAKNLKLNWKNPFANPTKYNSAGRLIDARTGRYITDPSKTTKTATNSKHGNSLDATGPHDVYAIRNADDGRILHFGETGRGFGVRGQEWTRELQKEYGLDTVVEHLKTVGSKRAARTLETRYIETYEKAFGFKPGFVDETGNFIQIQKTTH